MSDLISRQDAIDRINGTGYADQIKNNLILILRKLPSARPTGEWKQTEINGYPYAVCDQCYLLADMVENNGKIVMSMANADEQYANYCPNCGAKMTGGEE